nr:hypothetical protein JUJ52_10670 [Virgibacillus sp. AGTR]
MVGGEETINDPDKLIYRIDWKSPDELTNLALSYPEDKTFLIEYIQNYKHDDLSIKNDRELIGEHLNNDIDEK